MGDYEEHEITIGEHHFAALDLCDAIRISDAIQKESENSENREPNQCVLLHLVAGTRWVRTKRQKGATVMKKVLFRAEERRRGGISQAHQALERCVGREYHAGKELRSLSHDVLNNGHGPGYRGISLFSHSLLAAREINVRVFDLRVREEGGYELRAIYLQTPEGAQWPVVDFLALKHYMRWMKQCPDILASAKRACEMLHKPHLKVLTVNGWKDKCRLPSGEVGMGGLQQCRNVVSVIC